MMVSETAVGYVPRSVLYHDDMNVAVNHDNEEGGGVISSSMFLYDYDESMYTATTSSTTGANQCFVELCTQSQ